MSYLIIALYGCQMLPLSLIPSDLVAEWEIEVGTEAEHSNSELG